MHRAFLVFAACLFLSACGGGGGGSSGAASTSSSTTSPTTTPTTPTPPPLTNFTTLTVDAGPAALRTGGNNYFAYNQAYATVTLCAPGTSNCQTIDHVLVDTGSTGLRILTSVLSPTLLNALPMQADANANPVGECYGYVDSYAFGSVRQADFQIGGEAVANMPLQIIGDTGRFSTVPSFCSSGGGTNISTVVDLSANGIIGIGVTTTDCGANCTVAGGYGAAIYYDCPATGCTSIITRAAATTAPFQQLPNPVAAMSVDNNGTIMSLAATPGSGQATATGALIFGIGTQANNSLETATVLTTTTSSNPNGAGFVTALYNAQSLNQSYIDSGTAQYSFTDKSITPCTDKANIGYYCPASPLSLSPQIQGANGIISAAPLVLYNADTLFAAQYSALPGIGANPNAFANSMSIPRSFAFGLPFFFGRNVYTAIEGRSAGGQLGPYFAY